MSPVQPLTTDWREWSRFMQSQSADLKSVAASTNIGPMRELIPQLGPIRKTDANASYQTLSANVVYAVPFLISADFWDIDSFHWVCGTFGNGNICAGVYSETGTRLVTTGTIATANQMDVTISPAVRLTRNRYYFAIVANNATDTIATFTGTPYGNDSASANAAGLMAHSTIAFPLPATVALVPAGFTYIPAVYVGIAAST